MSHIVPEPTTSAHTQNHTDTDSVAPDLALNAMDNATPPVLQTGEVVPVTYNGTKVGEATVLEDGSVSVHIFQHETFGSFRATSEMTSFSFDTEESSVEEGH